MNLTDVSENLIIEPQQILGIIKKV